MKILNKNNRYLFIFFALFFVPSLSLGENTVDMLKQIPLNQTKIITTISVPLTVSVSPSATKVEKGKYLTFKAKINYENAKLTWKLDNKTASEKSIKLTVDTHKLSIGRHAVTLEVNLIRKGFKPQRRTVRTIFTIIGRKSVVPTIIEAPVITPTQKPVPTIKPTSTVQSPKTAKPHPITKPASKVAPVTVKKDSSKSQPNSTPVTPSSPEEPEPTIKVEPAIDNSSAVVNVEEPPIIFTGEDSEDSLSYSIAIEEEKKVAEPKPNETNDAVTEPTENGEIGGLIGKANTTDAKHYGEILYNPPTEMIKNKAERVEIRIGWDSVDDKGLIGTGAVQIELIPVSTSMTVKLCCGSPDKDYPFDIVSLNTETTQIIDPTGYTQWAFDVTPRKSGTHNLNLSVSARYTFPNQEIRTKDIPVITRIIRVKVDATAETKSWFIQHWKWIISSILVPLFLWFLSYRFNRQKNQHRKIKKDIKVFISYRRDDSSGYSLALYEQLNPLFGDENIFMDMDDIPHGSDFVKEIETVLSQAQIVLVMIGKQWLNTSNDNGRRLDNPKDFVRLEIATALQRNIRVIPVLLKGAKMPSEAELPDVLKALSRRNAIHIHDDQFEGSVQRLIKTIMSE